MTTTFENAKIGDKVWCLYFEEWSTITDINMECKYPIQTDLNSYTIDGRINIKRGRTLFWDEVKIAPPEKPLPKLEVDTKVLVWNYEEDLKQKRYFSHFDELGKIYVFAHGATSWSPTLTVAYKNWTLADA